MRKISWNLATEKCNLVRFVSNAKYSFLQVMELKLSKTVNLSFMTNKYVFQAEVNFEKLFEF